MKITFELTAKDAEEARRAYYRHLRPKGDRYICGLLYLVGLIFIVSQVWLALESIAHGRGLRVLGYLNLFMFIEGWGLLFVAWFIARHGPLYSFRSPGHHGPQTMEIGEGGITMGSEGRFAENSVPWMDFSRPVETQVIFVLLTVWPSNTSSLFAYTIRGTPNSLYVIPKRAFGPGGVEEFRNLLGTHVPGVSVRVDPRPNPGVA